MKKLYFFILASLFFNNDPISLVYNLKTRRAFRLGGAASSIIKKESLWLLSVIPIIYKRSRHIETNIFDSNLNVVPVDVCEERKVGGSIFNLRYIHKKKLWFEITAGAESEHALSCGTIALNKTVRGIDDLVFSLGYNVFPTEKIQITGYVIGGIPINRKLTTDEVFDTFVGTRFYALGAGAEFSYTFVSTLKETFAVLAQTRFLHFFSRRWTPILPCSAILQPGNVTDMLVAGQYRKKRNIFELGYDSTFFTNQAILLTTGIVTTDKFIRNSFYLNIAHLFKKFPIFKENSVLFGGGFYVASVNRYETKISSYWLNFTLIF